MSTAPSQHPNAAELPQPGQETDPDFLSNPHYSKWCGCGSIVVIHPTTCEVTITPLRCGSWVCPYCGPRKAEELKRRLRSAHASRFLTLTCAHTPGSTPADAEDAIRKGWPQFIAALRKLDSTLQYFRVMEWQQNGWPHLHVLLRCRFLPKPLIAAAWHRYCWPGHVNIRAVTNPEGMPHELTKYIVKAYTTAKLLDKHQRLFCSSRDFFPPKPSDTVYQPDPEAIWFITTDTPDRVKAVLTRGLPLMNAPQEAVDGHVLTTYASLWRAWLQAILDDCSRLPWYNSRHTGQCHDPPVPAR